MLKRSLARLVLVSARSDAELFVYRYTQRYKTVFGYVTTSDKTFIETTYTVAHLFP